MPKTTQPAIYRKNQNGGVITLNGVVGIFEALTLHKAALQALDDTNAQTIKINASKVERFDISTLQIIKSLKSSLASSGRKLEIIDTPASVTEITEKIGISL